MNDQKGKILAVDTDESVLTSVSRILGGNCDVETVNTAADAIKAMKSINFDIVLMDFVMAQDGQGLLASTLGIDPDIRVIVTDFTPSVERAIKTMRAGAFDYIFKPINPESLTESIATAIQDRRERLESRYLEDVFYEVKTAVASSLNLEKVLDSIVQGVVKAIKVKGSSLSLLDKSHERLIVVATHGLSRNYSSKGPIDSSKSLAESIVSGETVWIRDASSDPRTQYPQDAKREGVASILSIPLKTRGKIIGSLRVYCAEERVFSGKEMQVLREFSDQAAMAIHNARSYDDVKNEYDNMREDLRLYFDEIGWD